MLTDNERAKLMERFLTGTMDAEELRTFTDMLEHEPQLRSELERESGVDALLHNAGTGTLADKRFDAALDRAVGKAVPLPSKKQGILRGHWMQLYALAASLLLVASGMYIVASRQQTSVASAGNEKGPDMLQRENCRHDGKSIYRLSDRALFLSEEGSKVKVIPGDDSAVNVVLSQGNVCFDIGDDDPHTITVATPHAAVILSKRAVTRVVVTELETEIAVLEGNAEVIHRYHRNHPRELATGGTVFADFKTVQVAQNLAPEVCESRTNMFKAYVSWVQKQVHS